MSTCTLPCFECARLFTGVWQSVSESFSSPFKLDEPDLMEDRGGGSILRHCCWKHFFWWILIKVLGKKTHTHKNRGFITGILSLLCSCVKGMAITATCFAYCAGGCWDRKRANTLNELLLTCSEVVCSQSFLVLLLSTFLQHILCAASQPWHHHWVHPWGFLPLIDVSV